MATTPIDTLRYARRLEAASVSDRQAEEMDDALGAELGEHLVARTDLDAMAARVRSPLLRLTWMAGFTLAFVVATAWRVFAGQ